jgi:hypothetical protein
MQKAFALGLLSVALLLGSLAVINLTVGGSYANAAIATGQPATVEQVSNCTCKGNCACTTNNGTLKCRTRCGL